MKIAVPADGASLDAHVEARLGRCAYLLIVDAETLAVEAVGGPARGGRAAGAVVAAEAIGRDVHAVLAGYVSPMIRGRLEEGGIEVVTGAGGTVRRAVQEYVRARRAAGTEAPSGGPKGRGGKRLAAALGRSARQLVAILPVMLGVVLCIGLFKAFLSKEMLAAVFRGRAVGDTLAGALFGSILAGHPVNSFLIARALLDRGVSLFAATALIVTWVSVGLVQVPAEIAALGRRFALVRFAASFVISVGVAMLAVVLVELLT